MKGKERQQKTRGNGKLNNTNNLQQMTTDSSSPRFPYLTKTAIKQIRLKMKPSREKKEMYDMRHKDKCSI